MAEKIGYLVKRVQQNLRGAMDSRLRLLQLTTAQYAALTALEQAPHLSNAALARACFVTPQTMIEILQGLERMGLVARQAHPQHGRILQTELTAAGAAKLEQAHAVSGEIEAQMLRGFTPEEEAHLHRWLLRCCENLAAAI